MNLAFINIINLLVLFLSFFLFSRVAGSMSLKKLNMISFIFYVDIVLFMFIGSTMIINQVDNHYLINKLQNPNVRLYGWASLMYTMIALPVGMILAKYSLGVKSSSRLLDSYLEKKIEPLYFGNDSYIKIFLFFLSSISVIAVIYTFYYIGTIPLGHIFSSTSTELLELRSRVSLNFEGNEYIKNILGLYLTPILTFIAYAYYKSTNNSIDKLWFRIMLITSIFILSYNLAKTPLLFFLSGFLFFKILYKGKIQLKTLFRFTLVIFIALIIIYIGITNTPIEQMISSYNTGIIGRVLLTQNAGLYSSFEVFPDHHYFLHFSSISKQISSIFHLPYSETSARIIMETLNPEGVKNGTAGVVNSLFTGEAWANWGIQGIIIAPILVGYIIGFLYTLLLRLKKTPIYIGFFVFFSYHSSITGGVNGYLFNAGNIIMFILFSTILILSNQLLKNNTP